MGVFLVFFGDSYVCWDLLVCRYLIFFGVKCLFVYVMLKLMLIVKLVLFGFGVMVDRGKYVLFCIVFVK